MAVLADRDAPQQVSAADLDAVVSDLVGDVCRAALSPKDGSGYDWWKVLFALYPNSKATHSTRPRERGVLQKGVEELFTPDGSGSATLPCTFCGAGASVVWGKSNLPLFDTSKALNTLPPGIAGWPVCRGCRVAMWALPYGSWVTVGSATVLSCESTAAEREFAQRNVRRARRIMQAGFTGLPVGARPEYVALVALRDAGTDLCATTLLSFKNDNQEPWLRVTRTRRAVGVFMARVDANAPLRRGWHLLARALTRHDTQGRVVASGAQEAARLVFEAEDGASRSLLRQLFELLQDANRSWSSGDREALARLASAFAKEVLGMDTDLAPVATLIADWIAGGSSPRGRFAEYRNAALSDYKLGALLMQAYSRLLLDGSSVQLAGPEGWEPLIRRRPRAWEQRMLLFAQVSVLLQQRGVTIGEKPDSPEEQRRIDELENRPMLDEDVFDYEMGPA
ncbi:hypothetical protein AB0L85_10895 [Streptomyces sp. NPDC052051]|uniref:hypothetical protein n=1 Tax=Streptomyces sp. NPDC052051 TaxID=3154649 RepID=UPI0034376BB8